MYSNVDNSILPKLDHLKGLLASEDIHIAGFVETKPKSGNLPPEECIQIQGYDCLRSPHYEDPETRGTMLYVKTYLNASLIETDECKQFKDCTWIKIPTTDGDLIIACIYRSGSPAKAVKLDKDLNKMINHMTTSAGYKSVLIMGDFNYPDIEWSPDPVIVTEHRNQNHPEILFVNLLNETMLKQHVLLPTRDSRVMGQRSTKDDLIFTTDADMITNLEHLGHLGQSDHQILRFNTQIMFKKHKNTAAERYKYRQADLEEFKKHMMKDWHSILENKSTDEGYEIFLNHYKEGCEKFVPKEKINQNDRFMKPIWMKHSTMNLIKRKRRIHIKFLNTRNADDKNNYNKIRNEVTAALRKDRLCFERNISKEIKNNNKIFWRYVNSQRTTRSTIPNLQRKDGSMANTDVEKAEVLNQQFASVFTKEDLTNIPDFDPHPCTSFLENITITPDVVKKKLTKLRTDKSCGPDEVHPLLLNNLAEYMAIPLTIIFNSSIQTGTVPKIWKRGVVTAIFKKGKKCLASNYRGITLTSVVCKTLEKIIVEKIVLHLKANHLNNKNQHGFTPKMSTVTNLIEVLNIWSESVSHGIPVDVLYLDYEKAFDKVPHERLIRQLNKFGIKGNTLLWIKDYLHDRSQRVRVNGAMSSSIKVLSGVPQGSVLGPALFLIFVADVSSIINNCISLYADDTKIFNSLFENSHESLQEDINTLSRWADEMQMSYNIDKCHTLHLGSRNKHHTYFLPKITDIKKTATAESYTITLHPLKNVKEEKDLGVIVDENLNFKSHISAKISKANSMIYLVKNCFKYLDAEMFKTLYKTLIRPHLEYASPIWSPITKCEILRLEGVQRRATKLIPELQNLPYTDRLKHLKLPTLQFRRIRQDLLLLYNYVHQNVIFDTNTHCSICNITNMLNPVISGTRGHPYRYAIQRHPNIRNRFYTTRVLNYWNNLHTDTVTAPNINIFKNRLSKDSSMPSTYLFAGNTSNSS